MKSKEKATIIAALIGGIFVCAAAVIGLGLPFVELWVDQHLRAVTPIITPTQPVALTSAPISTDEHSSSSQPYPSAVPAVSPSPSYTKTPIIAATTSIVPTPTPSWTVTSTRERVETWVQVGLPNEAISDLIIANNGVYYAATKGYHHGIFKSVDRGITWTAINNGLGNLEVGGIDVSDVIPDHIVAATEGGLWLTNDGGAHWQLCDSIPYRDESFVDVSFVPGDASKIVAVGVANYGAFITYDAGRTWSGTYDHWRNMSFLQVCISAKPTPLIYLFSYVAGYRSNDLGKSWNGIANVGANYYVPRVAVDPTNASILYACAGRSQADSVSIRGHGVYKSVDSGSSWIATNTGLPSQGFDAQCTAITVNSANSSNVYAAIADQICSSNDGGESWEQLPTLPNKALSGNPFVGSVSRIVIDNEENKICIGTALNGIWCLSLVK